MARRVSARELETAISDELLALLGDAKLTEDKVIPCRDFPDDINRTVEQMTHLYKEIQLAALAGENVAGKQETLRRAQEELARLHALPPAQARVEPVSTGQTFRQRWATLDAAGRNEFLRSNAVRAVVSRDELPPIEHQGEPLTPQVPRTAIIDQPGLHTVIYLGTLGEMLRRASGLSATTRPS